MLWVKIQPLGGGESFEPGRFLRTILVKEQISQILSGVRQSASPGATAGEEVIAELIVTRIHKVCLTDLKVVTTVVERRPNVEEILVIVFLRLLVFGDGIRGRIVVIFVFE